MASFNFGGMMQGLGEGLQSVGKQQVSLLEKKEERDWRSREAELAHQRVKNLEEQRNKRNDRIRKEDQEIAAKLREEDRAQFLKDRAEERIYQASVKEQDAAAEIAKRDETLARGKELMQEKWTDVFESEDFQKLPENTKSFMSLAHSSGVDPADALKAIKDMKVEDPKMNKVEKSHLDYGTSFVDDIEGQTGVIFPPIVRYELGLQAANQAANPNMRILEGTVRLDTPEAINRFAEELLQGKEGSGVGLMELAPATKNEVLARLAEIQKEQVKEARREVTAPTLMERKERGESALGVLAGSGAL